MRGWWRGLAWWAVGWAVAVFVAILALSPVEPMRAAPPAPGSRLLVDTEDAAANRELAALGATKLVDYGAFALWRLPAARTPAAALRDLAARPGVETAVDFDAILLRGGARVDTAASVGATLRPSVPSDWVGPPTQSDGTLDRRVAPTDAGALALVQFIGPIKPEWRAELRGLGLEIVQYAPVNAYVVWGDAAALGRLADWAARSWYIQWTGPLPPADRLSPRLRATDSRSGTTDSRNGTGAGVVTTTVAVTVQFADHAGVDASVDRLLALATRVLLRPSTLDGLASVSVRLPAGQTDIVAGWPDVFNVEPYAPPRKLDEVQDLIIAGRVTGGPNLPTTPTGPGYLAWLKARGVPQDPAAYPIVDIVDDGIDNGHASAVLHPDFKRLGTGSSRVAYIGNCTTDPLGDGLEGHGNLNAGIVGGYNNRTVFPYVDAAGYRLGLGVSPFGRLAGTKVFNNSGPFDAERCGWTYAGIVAASARAGARITSDSWGAATWGDYDGAARAYDALTRDALPGEPGDYPMLHVFSAGNNGPIAGSLGSPGTAKNVITVGATQNVRDDGVIDGCWWSQARNADLMADFSSRGPATDGRVKPDLVAPGTHVQGAASQDPGFDALGVCAMDDSKYYPPNQTLYTWSSGTSHSAPAVAGAAQLAYVWYQRKLTAGLTPSPAMVKALLINSSRLLAPSEPGVAAEPPSRFDQGWGDPNLSRLFDLAPRQLVDQSVVLTTGRTYTVSGAIADPTKPFRATLVWTDPPGSTISDVALVNDLDLEVSVGGVVYKGNQLVRDRSVPGGVFDRRNNVENVFLPPGVGSSFSVRVIAANVPGDALPGSGGPAEQDFALVVYGAAAPSALDVAGVRRTEVIGNGDGIVDAGETWGLDVDLLNVGAAPATRVSGLIYRQSGLSGVVTGQSIYPDVPVGEQRTNATRYLVWIDALARCGQDVVLQHQVTYGGGRVFRHPISIPVGALGPEETRSFAYTGSAVPIPASVASAASATVPITVGGVITAVRVHVDIRRDRASDLSLVLIAPNGVTVTLSARNGDGADYQGTVFRDDAAASIKEGAAPFAGEFRPEQPLAWLAGASPRGAWTLQVVDRTGVGGGQIEGFGLDIDGQYHACPPSPPFPGRYYFPLMILREASVDGS